MKIVDKIKNIKNLKRMMLVVGILSVILAGGGYSMYQSGQPIEVAAVNVEEVHFEEYHVEEGTVDAVDSVRVYSPEGELVKAIHVEEGQSVLKDTLLFEMDTMNLQYELESLLAQKESVMGQSKAEEEVTNRNDIQIQAEAKAQAKRDMDLKKKDYEAQTVLFENGAISKDNLSQIEETYTNAKSNFNIENFKLQTLKDSQNLGEGKTQYYEGVLEGLNIQIDMMNKRILDAQVTAPMSGTISAFDFKVGDRLLKNVEVMKITNPSSVEVVVYTTTKSSKQLQVGNTAFVEVESQNDYLSIPGTIKYIANSATEVVSPLGIAEKKVKVVVTIEENSDFMVGEKTDVKFVTYQKENAKVISRDYIFPWQDGEAVWVLKNGQADISMIDKVYENATKVILEDTFEEEVLIIPPYADKLKIGADVIGD